MKQFINDFIEKIVGRKLNKGLLQFFRYLVCGSIATLTDVSILFALTHFLRVNYLIAAACAFLTGIIVNYSLNIILVFQSSGKIKKEFPLFAMIGIGGLIWTELILWVLVDRLNIYVMIAKAVAIVLVLNWNFFMRKKFVFFQESISEESSGRNMRILTIAATPFFSDRGCHIRIYNGAKYLKKFGAKVKICTYFDGENVDGLDIEKIEKVGWYKKISPGFSWGKLWLDIKLIFLCRREIKMFRPDIIHAHLYEGLGVGYIAKLLAFRSIPIVIDLQGDLEEEFRNYNRKNYVARRIFVWLSKRLISRCDWLVLSSENMKAKMDKMLQYKNKITVIRDGVDLDLFRNMPELTGEEREKIEKIKKWSGDRKLLVYIGGLSDNKGVGELLEGFKKFADQSREWKLLIGGFGSDEEKYKEFVKEDNLGDSIYFAGKVKYFSLPTYLVLADAGIDPKSGSTESSGKLANLMAARMPVVCFESEFNRARLGDKGIYMKNINELCERLNSFQNTGKIEYNIEDLGEEKEIRKLFEIFRTLMK